MKYLQIKRCRSTGKGTLGTEKYTGLKRTLNLIDHTKKHTTINESRQKYKINYAFVRKWQLVCIKKNHSI